MKWTLVAIIVAATTVGDVLKSKNAQSRAALLKLGASQEGILRHHRVLPDGSLRDSVVFSILAAEWPAIREALEKRLGADKRAADQFSAGRVDQD